MSRMIVVAVLIAVALSGGCVKLDVVDVEQEKANVRQVLDKYLQSVNGADLQIASEIWSQTPDTSVVAPFGRFEGWEKVREGVYVNFLQKLTERRLQAENIAIHVDGETAWAAFDWNFAGKLANGQPVNSKGWESHVYRKTPRGWVIVHLHYSVPPPPPPAPAG
jgi:ketosteroid isomerase-like protein